MSKIEQYQQLLSPDMMYSQQAITLLSKKLLPQKRYDHVLRVLDTALILAKKFDIADKEKITIAAIFHDFAKGMTSDELAQYALIYNIDLGEAIPSAYHAIVGSWMVSHFFNIHDEDIIQAIYYHTTGSTNFLTNKIGAILFLADYIEPGRPHKIDHIQQFIPQNLNRALREVVKSKVCRTIHQDKKIDNHSINFYHHLLKEE